MEKELNHGILKELDHVTLDEIKVLYVWLYCSLAFKCLSNQNCLRRAKNMNLFRLISECFEELLDLFKSEFDLKGYFHTWGGQYCCRTKIIVQKYVRLIRFQNQIGSL